MRQQLLHSLFNYDMHLKTPSQKNLFFLNLPINVKYALLVLLDLANERATSLNEMATKYCISKPDLELICSNLQQGGLISSYVNSSDSYALKRQPEQITLLDVVRSMESQPSTAQDCEGYTTDRLLIHKIWAEARTAAQNTLRDYTLQDFFFKTESLAD